MEDVLVSWPVEAPTLEPLQPLSFSIIDDQETSISLDKLSRSEIAGKLLDHLDQIADEQETEPFDWFASEKSIDLPIFEHLSSPVPVGIQNNRNAAVGNNKLSGLASAHYTYFDSPEYEPTFAPTNYAFGESSSVVPAGATTQSPQLTYVPSFGTTFAMANNPPPIDATTATSATSPTTTQQTVSAPHFVDVDPKREVLTPPDSPKDEEILRLLQEIEPADWEKLMFGERSVPVAAATTPAADTSCNTTISENSCPADELSDYATSSSSCVGSECSSDNDAEYVPTKGGRKMSDSSVASSKRRASKPYSRPSVEERRLRKKEQNKNAATRYRMKKKQEAEESKNEETNLADRNRELRTKLDDISREIKCLKSLMRDVYRKKGLIN